MSGGGFERAPSPSREPQYDDAKLDREHVTDERPPGKRTLTEKLRPRRADAQSARDRKRSDADADTDSGLDADLDDARPAARSDARSDTSSGVGLDAAAPAAPALATASLAGMSREQTFSSVFESHAPALHACSAACGHQQFARMMMAFAGGGAGPEIHHGAFQAAVAKHNQQRLEGFRAAAAAGRPVPTDPSGAAGPAGAAAATPAQAPPDHARNAGVTPGPGTAHAGVSNGTVAGFPTIMGLTTFSGSTAKGPAFAVDTTGKDADWKTKVKTTTSSPMTPSAVATAAGTYAAGKFTTEYDEIQADGKTIIKRQITLDKSIKVEAADNTDIVAGENEHLADLKLAYDLTFKAVETAINAMAAKEYKGATQAEAEKAAKDALKAAVDAKLTENAANWGVMLDKCAQMTKSGRDAAGLHNMGTVADQDSDYDFAKKTVVFRVDKSGLSLGTASSAIVTL